MLRCEACGRDYPFSEGRIFFDGLPENLEGDSDDIVFLVKHWLKRRPMLFRIAYFLQPALAIGKGPDAIAQSGVTNPIYLNLGSGTPLYWKAGVTPLIQVDLHPYPGVDLVCDGTRLPFRDNDVDGVYNESLLEHTPDPEAIVNEVLRVLKPLGKANFILPQVAPFHSAPHDYTRWTVTGGQKLLKRFDYLESGVRQGPISAWLWQTQEIIAIVFSFGVPSLYAAGLMLATVATFPIKYLDWLVGRLPGASRIALTLYFVVRKKEPFNLV